jgi:hypothetical protein
MSKNFAFYPDGISAWRNNPKFDLLGSVSGLNDKERRGDIKYWRLRILKV